MLAFVCHSHSTYRACCKMRGNHKKEQQFDVFLCNYGISVWMSFCNVRQSLHFYIYDCFFTKHPLVTGGKKIVTTDTWGKWECTRTCLWKGVAGIHLGSMWSNILLCKLPDTFFELNNIHTKKMQASKWSADRDKSTDICLSKTNRFVALKRIGKISLNRQNPKPHNFQHDHHTRMHNCCLFYARLFYLIRLASCCNEEDLLQLW
jgi:hypothetical protein